MNLKYDEKSPSGLVYIKAAGSRKADDFAGSRNTDGYWRVSINGKRYPAHRIVWELHNSSIPEGLMVDHVDRNKDNNILTNLRLATSSINNSNRTFKRYYLTPFGWRVRAVVEGKRKTFGTFRSEQQAIQCCIDNGLN